MPEKKVKAKDYFYAVGRRKRSSARVRLFKGKGVSTVNDQPIETYFSGIVNKISWEKPFRVIGSEGKFYITVKVIGGGVQGQLDATVHGIAKALEKLDRQEYRNPLKKAGFLTRDSRKRERRKIGTGGKARRKKQSPKR